MMCSPKSYCNSCDSFIGLVSSFFLELVMMHQQFNKMESRIWYRYSIHIYYYYWILPRQFFFEKLKQPLQNLNCYILFTKFIRIYVYFVCKHFQCQLCEIISSYCLFVQQFCIVKNLSKLL